jgi:hypothetical protein
MVDGLAKVILRTLLRAGCYVASRVVLENYAIGYNKAAKCERERESAIHTNISLVKRSLLCMTGWKGVGWLTGWKGRTNDGESEGGWCLLCSTTTHYAIRNTNGILVEPGGCSLSNVAVRYMEMAMSDSKRPSRRSFRQACLLCDND